MNNLSTDDARELSDKILNTIQDAPRRMRDAEIEEAVTMAYKKALGIPTTVSIFKEYVDDPKPIRVYSIGPTVEGALLNFFQDLLKTEKVEIELKERLEDSSEFSWGFAIQADGTSYKTAGTYISGYAVLTWWK